MQIISIELKKLHSLFGVDLVLHIRANHNGPMYTEHNRSV